jgi:GNAT superfamily N-acetyltransferase
MGMLTTDFGAWVEAGGDGERLRVLERVGRVAVFTDGDSRALAGIHPARPHIGTIGDWVGSPVALKAAERWLAEQGCRATEGPMLLAPWFPYRANLGPYEQPPFAFEPTERGDRWEGAGYKVSARYVSIVATHDPQIKAGVDRAAALGSRGWRLESVDTGPSSTITPEAFDKAFLAAHDLANRAFADVPGFVPVEPGPVAAFYRPLASHLDPRLTLFARDPQGKPAGFVLATPDFVQPKRKWFQILTLAVAPEHRSTGVATWMVAAVHQAARRAGYLAGVHALIRSDGDGMEDTTWFRGDVVRRYALYRKTW